MKPQINALTSTRAVAAILVVIHHFGSGIYPFNLSRNLFHCGDIAVSYFFVLSGFVLFISYTGRKMTFADYFKRRVGRIVPVYLLALILMIVVSVVYLKYVLDGRALKEIVLSATFLQAYAPSYPLSLNSPAWSISVEMFFYITFPLFLFLINKNFRGFAIMAFVLYAAAQYFHLKYYPARWSLPDSVIDTVFFNPVMHINQFLIGMTGGYFFLNGKANLPVARWGAFLLFAVIVLLIAFRPDSISYQAGLIAPVFMWFILCIAVYNPVALNAKTFVFLGEISYGTYILQFPVFKGLNAINDRYIHMPTQYFFFIGMAALLLVSGLSYRFIEKPLRKKINAIKHFSSNK